MSPNRRARSLREEDRPEAHFPLLQDLLREVCLLSPGDDRTSFMLYLGFFTDFAGGDSVLLHGNHGDIAELTRQLQRFSVSEKSLFPIHAIAAVSPRHPATLFANRLQMKVGHDFQWLCSRRAFEAVAVKLAALAAAPSAGHQCFELMQSPVTLIVSVNEYGPQWWGKFG